MVYNSYSMYFELSFVIVIWKSMWVLVSKTVKVPMLFTWIELLYIGNLNLLNIVHMSLTILLHVSPRVLSDYSCNLPICNHCHVYLASRTLNPRNNHSQPSTWPFHIFYDISCNLNISIWITSSKCYVRQYHHFVKEIWKSGP